MIMINPSIATALAITSCALSPIASADLITWSTPLDTTALSEVSTNGVGVMAYNMAPPNIATVVLNGVTFESLVPDEWDSGGGSLMAISTTGDADFDQFLTVARTPFGTPTANPTGYGAIRLDTLGTLEIGKTYEIQVWYCDQRFGQLRDRVMNFSSVVGNVVTTGGIADNLTSLNQGDVSGMVEADPNNLNGAMDTIFGQYCLGTFSRSSSDPLWLLVEGTHPVGSQLLRPHLTGFQVREVGVGSPYCFAEVNSSGASGEMSASGSTIATQNSLSIEATNLPPLVFGFFITSELQGFVMNPGGSFGNLCLGGSVGRFVGPGQIQNSGTAGTISIDLDLTQQPQPNGFVSVMAGDTWSFQAWFRDSMGGQVGSNFTNGLEVIFQ